MDRLLICVLTIRPARTQAASENGSEAEDQQKVAAKQKVMALWLCQFQISDPFFEAPGKLRQDLLFK